MPGGIISIQNVSINTISEINDFINSFNGIIDKVYNYSPIDKIFAELFKKANYFDFHTSDLKKVEKFKHKISENMC